MNKRTGWLGWLGWVGVLACSGCAGGTEAQAEPVMPVAPIRAAAPVARSEPARATSALEYHDGSESDRVFIDNAERAIGEYTAFIERAGDREEYAQAVKRSREQIKDLRDALIFVRGEGSK